MKVFPQETNNTPPVTNEHTAWTEKDNNNNNNNNNKSHEQLQLQQQRDSTHQQQVPDALKHHAAKAVVFANNTDDVEKGERKKEHDAESNSSVDSYADDRKMRRLTIDVRASSNYFALLPPSSRNRIQVLLLLLFGGAIFIFSLGAGIPLLGRQYNPMINVTVGTNGKMSNAWNFMGYFFLMYCGTLSIMLFSILLSSISVLDLPLHVLRYIIGSAFALSILAASLIMVYMIEPQKTWDPSVVTGLGDPLLSAVGAYLFVAFLYLIALSGSIFVRMIPVPSVHRSRKRFVNFVAHNRVWIFTGFFIISGLSLSNLMCSPSGAGETWPGRYFRATSPYSWTNWKWSDYFVYKLFPDVFFFYFYIATVVVVAYLANRRPALRHWLHRRIWAPSKPPTGWYEKFQPYNFGISNGEALMWIAGILMTLFWLLYWRLVFTYTVNTKVAKVKTNWGPEVAARLFGHLSNLVSALLLLPVSRTGLWVDVFAIPYDRAIKYHRILGTLGFLFVTIHAMLWWNKWANEGILGNNIAAFNSMALSPNRVASQDFSILLEEISWFLMAVSLLLAIFLRRRLYFIFQYTHKFIGVIYYITAITHAWSFWYFGFGSLVLWLCDKLSRGIQAAVLVAPSETEWYPGNNIVMLKLSNDSFHSYRPGQYFFINIPKLSMNEWHPFTASAVLDDGIVFYIKRMPQAIKSRLAPNHIPWTARLTDLVAESAALPSIRLSGPFGSFGDFEGYNTVVLFAGGIGITPMIAIFTSLLRKAIKGEQMSVKTVMLVWNSRSTNEFRLFEEIFALAAGSAASELLGARRDMKKGKRGDAAVPETDDDNNVNDSDLRNQNMLLGETSIDATTTDATTTTTPTTTAMDPNTTTAPTTNEMSLPCAVDENATTTTATTAGAKLDRHASAASVKRPTTAAAKAAAAQNKLRSVTADGSVLEVGDTQFHISLHCTKRESFVSLTDPNSADYTKMFIKSGRCDILNTLKTVNCTNTTGLAAVCGPKSLSDAVSIASWNVKCDFHAEEFAF